MILIIATMLVVVLMLGWIWLSLYNIYNFDKETEETTIKALARAETITNVDRNSGNQSWVE